MKRLLCALVLAAVPFSAAASPQLANEWGAKASELYGETVTLLNASEAGDTITVPDTYEVEIGRFAVMAGRLGSWIDGNDGPSDLGCIFRGMAQEGEVQLDALDSASNQAEIETGLKRLATMFSDAEIIAAAAAQSDGEDVPVAARPTATSCAANPEAMRTALQ